MRKRVICEICFLCGGWIEGAVKAVGRVVSGQKKSRGRERDTKNGPEKQGWRREKPLQGTE